MSHVQASALAHIGSQLRNGFETMITVDSAGPYFAVKALDADHHVLGRSPTVRVMS
jgi:hypothetical protein